MFTHGCDNNTIAVNTRATCLCNGRIFINQIETIEELICWSLHAVLSAWMLTLTWIDTLISADSGLVTKSADSDLDDLGRRNACLSLLETIKECI